MKKKYSLELSIIIVNWNGYENLKTCLQSLQKAELPTKLEIIIVDNGSQDKSVPYIKELQKSNSSIRLASLKENLGFAEGNNVGFFQAKGEYILFLNNDTLVSKTFYRMLKAKIESDPHIGGVQPKISMYPKIDFIDSVGSYFLTTGFLYHKGHNKKDKKLYNVSSKIFSMKGACMLFKHSVLDAVGVFDKKYFAYFEETDLCHRVILSGYDIWYEPTSQIYHKGGETAKKLPSAFVQFHSYKNRIYTILKNFEVVTIIKVIPLHIIYCLIISLVYLFTLQFSLSVAIVKAVFWNLTSINAIREERKSIATIRKRNDKDYLDELKRNVGFNYYYHLFTTSLAGYKEVV